MIFIQYGFELNVIRRGKTTTKNIFSNLQQSKVGTNVRESLSTGLLYWMDGSDVKMAAAVVQMSCLYRGMLAVRATGIRTLIPGLVPAQFRAFSVRKEPELEENPFFSKYQDKIQKLRRSAG